MMENRKNLISPGQLQSVLSTNRLNAKIDLFKQSFDPFQVFIHTVALYTYTGHMENVLYSSDAFFSRTELNACSAC